MDYGYKKYGNVKNHVERSLMQRARILGRGEDRRTLDYLDGKWFAAETEQGVSF